MSGGVFDPEGSQERLHVLENQVQDPHLWDDPQAAQKIMQEREALNTKLQGYLDLCREFSDTEEMLGWGEEDPTLRQEAESALEDLSARMARVRLESLLSGEADHLHCYLEVHAGAGGTEAQDWALMLQRLYLRWAEKRGFKTTIIDEGAGDEAGIKSCTIEIKGHQAFGWLKTERGVHRLVRISPFDSSGRRHTSFASVDVYPIIDSNIEIEINPSDLRIDTFRSSGAGGQHVNTTDSAVRITHAPTGVVVQCQSDRSQHRNRDQAMSMLRARLYEREMRRREEETRATHEAKTEIGWGHQIRSYVLHPYQMVKDLRTSVETGNTQAVLGGDIDLFIEAALAAGVR